MQSWSTKTQAIRCSGTSGELDKIIIQPTKERLFRQGNKRGRWANNCFPWNTWTRSERPAYSPTGILSSFYNQGNKRRMGKAK